MFFFPSPLVGEGGFERSEKPGEGDSCVIGTFPLTRLEFAPLILATLSHKGRGEEPHSRAKERWSDYAPISFGNSDSDPIR